MLLRARWTRGLWLVILVSGLLALPSGCKSEGDEDGTISIRLSGAGAHDGLPFYWGVFSEGADIMLDPPIAGTNDPLIIAGGAAQGVAVDITDAPVTFEGSTSYDVGALIDVDSDDIPSSGDYMTDPLKRVKVDGDMVVDLVYPTDFVLIP